MNYIITFIIIILLSSFNSAYGNNGIIDLKKEIEIKELEEILERRKNKEESITIDNHNNSSNNSINETNCICNNIKLEGNTIYCTDKLYNKFVKFNNNCITKKDLQNIRDNINNFYITNGYVNCRVYFNMLKDKNTILLVIHEGRINEVNGNSKLQILTAFPFRKKDRVFNIKEFNQGLDQMNRLQSNNITLEIKPTNQGIIGYSDINLINHSPSKRTTFFGISYDNGTGKNKVSFNITKDNLLSINDNIYLTYSTTNPEIKKDRSYYSDQIYTNISVPLGYYTMSFSYSNSKYKNKITKSNTDNFTYSLDRVIYRNNSYKNSITFELEDNNSRNYINDTLLNINSRRLYNIKVHFNNIFYLKNTGIISIKPTFQKGVNDNYNLYKLFMYYSNRFNNMLSYSLNINSQYTIADNLYGENKLALGSNSTVRGYKDIVLQSDSGFYIRNDLKINNPYYLLKKLQMNIFFDYGYVIDTKIKNNNIFGLGIGLRYLGKYLNGEVSYARGLRKLKDNEDNNKYIYFRVSMNI